MERVFEGVKRILNCEPSPDQEQDWSPVHAADAGLLAAAPIPSSKDLRLEWWTVGDQGNTGSCVGWAAADSVARWHFVKADWLETSQPLSTRFIWMASKETDEFDARPTTFIESDGTSLKAALDVLRKFGSVLDTELPFASGALYQGSARSFYAKAAQRKIASYFNLGTNQQEWKRWLANNGPILTRLDVDDTWMNCREANDGILDTYLADTAAGGHAVALVGYTQDGFIVRNSWGLLWGKRGYGFASAAYAGDAFTEAYGISI